MVGFVSHGCRISTDAITRLKRSNPLAVHSEANACRNLNTLLKVAGWQVCDARDACISSHR